MLRNEKMALEFIRPESLHSHDAAKIALARALIYALLAIAEAINGMDTKSK